MTPICISKLTIIGSDNGLSPGRCLAIIWIIAGILLIGLLGISFIEISIKINTFPFKKMHLKMLSAQWRLFCLGFNELMYSHNSSAYLVLCQKCSRKLGQCICSSHHIILKFSGAITISRTDIHAKGQSQSSKVKMTEVKTNFAQIWAFLRSSIKFQGHTGQKKITNFDMNWVFSDCNSSLN